MSMKVEGLNQSLKLLVRLLNAHSVISPPLVSATVGRTLTVVAHYSSVKSIGS